MVVKEGNKWFVRSEKGKNLGKPEGYDTKEEADERLREIEAFKHMKNKTMINMVQRINASTIKRETIEGDPHIIIPSATLPDNVVMNGGLYPADEIEKGYKSLEGVPAPAGHPMINGKYVSARDVKAINKHHVGAWVSNVRREDGRVYHDTIINERVAMQTEIGKQLIDAINKGDPIHTSTGVFLNQESLEKPIIANEGPSKGKEYTWIARNLHHDHQAILLNEQGAATPDEGVGMMVNSDGNDDEFKVYFANVESDLFDNGQGEPSWLDKLASKVAKLLQPNVKSTVNKQQPEEDLMSLLDTQLKELGVNFDENATEAEKLGLYTKAIATNAVKSVEQPKVPTSEDIAKIVTDTLAANKAQEAEEIKKAKVADLMKVNKDFTEDELMAMPESALDKLAPQQRAAGIGVAAPMQTNASSIADDTMPE